MASKKWIFLFCWFFVQAALGETKESASKEYPDASNLPLSLAVGLSVFDYDKNTSSYLSLSLNKHVHQFAHLGLDARISMQSNPFTRQTSEYLLGYLGLKAGGEYPITRQTGIFFELLGGVGQSESIEQKGDLVGLCQCQTFIWSPKVGLYSNMYRQLKLSFGIEQMQISSFPVTAVSLLMAYQW